MNELATPFPEPPPHVLPWFEVLGPSLIVPFLLAFGGAELYLAKDPKGRSRLEALVGHEKAAGLAEKVGDLKMRIPLAKPWLAAVFAWQGESTAEIARRLHVIDLSVRRWLRAAGMR